MKNLILLTSEFPYSHGEPFLVNELPYLSSKFKKVFIFSINGNKRDVQTRNTPDNVKSYPLGHTVSKKKYSKYIVKGLYNPDTDLKIKQYKINQVAASLYTRGRAFSIADEVFDIITKQSLDVSDTVIYSFWFAYQAVAAWVLSKKLNKQGNRTYAVARAHGYDLYWERAIGGFLPYQDSSLNNLVCCYPCSEYGTKYLLEKYPWASKKIKTARLGTRDHGENPYKGEKTLVTCCHLEPLKRMKLFAEVFCRIGKSDQRLKWICIGSGVEEEEIKKIVRDAGLSERVLMTGILPNEDVMEIYKKEGIAYFCNISTTEGLPVSIMEAMSFGIPVLATNVGGTSELVDPSVGFLIPPDLSIDKLANITLKAINESEEEHLKKRRRSRLKWEQMVSAERNYSCFVEEISSYEYSQIQLEN